jgi:DNA-binding NarL/FixJ family response regulator
MNPSAAPLVLWVVEDNAAFRRTLIRGLSRRMPGTSFHEFGSAEQALSAFGSIPSPQVFLLDVGLPGADGLKAMPLLHQAAPEAFLLILTVFEDDEKIFAAISGGAHGYLLKTAPVAQIVEAIHEVQAGGSPLTPRVARKVLEHFSTLKPRKPQEETVDLKEMEIQILRLIVEGLLKKEIADRLNVGIHTVDTQMRTIYRKLQVTTRAAAVAKTLQGRLLS